MVDEQEPAKRVVKRVVKKTVTRPAAPPPPADTPKLRYGRPVATAAKPKAKVQTPKNPTAKVSSPKVTRTRPKVEIGATIGAAGQRLGGTSRSAARGIRHGARSAGGFVGTRARVAAAWRLPHINLYLASVITGAVVGLVSVGLGAIALSIFSSIRGVASGGGFWGGLVFIAVSVVAYVLGAFLLTGFGSRSGRLTSFLGVIIAIVAMLGLFLGLADTSAALLVVPALGLASYALSHWLIELAEHAPAIVE